jgi:hypothetical protein
MRALARIRERRFELGKYGIARRRDIVAGEKILGESLRAFELCGNAARTEAALAGGAEPIDDASDQWRFRADDGETDLFALRQRQQAVQVGCHKVDVAHAGL